MGAVVVDQQRVQAHASRRQGFSGFGLPFGMAARLQHAAAQAPAALADAERGAGERGVVAARVVHPHRPAGAAPDQCETQLPGQVLGTALDARRAVEQLQAIAQHQQHLVPIRMAAVAWRDLQDVEMEQRFAIARQALPGVDDAQRLAAVRGHAEYRRVDQERRVRLIRRRVRGVDVDPGLDDVGKRIAIAQLHGLLPCLAGIDHPGPGHHHACPRLGDARQQDEQKRRCPAGSVRMSGHAAYLAGHGPATGPGFSAGKRKGRRMRRRHSLVTQRVGHGAEYRTGRHGRRFGDVLHRVVVAGAGGSVGEHDVAGGHRRAAGQVDRVAADAIEQLQRHARRAAGGGVHQIPGGAGVGGLEQGGEMLVGRRRDAIGELQGEGGFAGAAAHCAIEGAHRYAVEDHRGVGEAVDRDLAGLVGHFAAECDSVCRHRGSRSGNCRKGQYHCAWVRSSGHAYVPCVRQ